MKQIERIGAAVLLGLINSAVFVVGVLFFALMFVVVGVPAMLRAGFSWAERRAVFGGDRAAQQKAHWRG